MRFKVHELDVVAFKNTDLKDEGVTKYLVVLYRQGIEFDSFATSLLDVTEEDEQKFLEYAIVQYLRK